MNARSRYARPSDPPRFRGASLSTRIRRYTRAILRTLWRLRSEIAIAVIVMFVMEQKYRDDVAAEQSARIRAESDRDGVVELIRNMIHKPDGYSIAISAPTPDQLVDRLQLARQVVLAEEHRQ